MPSLEITNVRKQFGPTVAVGSVDLQVERGELVSFLLTSVETPGALLTGRGRAQPGGAR